MPLLRVSEHHKLGGHDSRPEVSTHLADRENAKPSATSSTPHLRTQVRHGTQGVICFNDESRVILVSNQAESFSVELFGCTPRAGEPLPQELIQCTIELRGTSASAAEGSPKRDYRTKGKCVSISLAFDPQGNYHCLIFERKKEVTEPEQLQALSLSPRETLVTFWILHQKTNWEIGKILQISTRTVDKHVEKIFLKLGVNDRRDLVLRAREVCDP